MENGETVSCLLFRYAMACFWTENGVGRSGPEVGSRRDPNHKNEVQDAPFRVGQHNRQGDDTRMNKQDYEKWRQEYIKWIDSLFPLVIPKGYVSCGECNGQGQIEFTGDIWPVVDYCPVCNGEGFLAAKET